MRLFFIAQRVPFPPDRGDKITTCNELRHLARHHEVHVFCLADGREDLANVEGVRALGAEITAVPVLPWRARLRAAAALLTGRPLSVAMIREPALAAAIEAAEARLRPDLIFVYSSNMAQFVERFGARRRIMQFADLDSLKWARYAEESGPPMRWLYAREARLMRAYEQRIARGFDHSVVCTDEERADFVAAIPGVPVSTLRNGVDLEYFRSAGAARVPGRMVFTGVMDYRPNVDAVVWFANEILPRVRAAVPGASFVICGSRPAPAVQALALLPGVTVTGRVPDVRPYLDSAELFVAPLRIARGIQNKVIEAMAMGLPVVASVPAWTGTGLAEGEGGVVAADAETFAQRAASLLGDPARRAAMGEAGRRAVERDYAWDTQFAVLDRIVAEAAAGGPRA